MITKEQILKDPNAKLGRKLTQADHKLIEETIAKQKEVLKNKKNLINWNLTVNI